MGKSIYILIKEGFYVFESASGKNLTGFLKLEKWEVEKVSFSGLEIIIKYHSVVSSTHPEL